MTITPPPQDDGEVDLRKSDELPTGCEDEPTVEIVKMPGEDEEVPAAKVEEKKEEALTKEGS